MVPPKGLLTKIINDSAADRSAKHLSWALCIATLNRIDVLETCLHYALAQTRQPAEIVIVDASENWDDHRRRITILVERHAITLRYLKASRKSIAAQRNEGIAAATADVCFLIDDDSFMYPDCAEEIMHVYEHRDADKVLAVVASDAPPPTGKSLELERKLAPTRNGKFDRYRHWAVFRWCWKNILMMSAEKVFIPYDGPYRRGLPQELDTAGLAIIPVALSSGYKMTARRHAVLANPFEDAFQSYSPAEDLDFFYRLTRHGFLVCARNARLYHHEIAASRLKRQTATLLSITNIAYLVRRYADRQAIYQFRFTMMLLRRMLAELIKDAGSRRWGFNQTRGVIGAIPVSLNIFRQDPKQLAEWYKDKQLQILRER